MRTLLMVALLVLAPMASAAETQSASLQTIVEQQVALREELSRGPQDLTPRQVGIMRKAQGEFFRIVDGKTTMDQLAIDEKVQLENALERINAQFVGTSAARAKQEVCWREKIVGSKLHVTRCASQQELDQTREGARGFLERPRICVPPGCGA